MKKSLLMLVFAASFLIACTNKAACTQESMMCPDGAAVGRTGPGCGFADCPVNNETITAGCNYNDPVRKYAGKSPDECSKIRFMCEPNSEYFADECGCGCSLKNGSLAGHLCTPEQKKAEACIEIFEPVCGWLDPEKIQCIRYPCAQTFGNSCVACKDERIVSWTEGECPA